MQHELGHQPTLLLIQDIESVFDPSRFNLRRLPANVGAIDPNKIGTLPSSLDMLIKLPEGKVILPEPYLNDEGVCDFIEQSLRFEDIILPGWRDHYYAYLTIDRRKVEQGRSHRNEGWHFDGMQGGRFPDKMKVCHQYVMSTSLPTEYTSFPTDASNLDEMHHNWFKELGGQVPDDEPTYRSEAGNISLMSAYQLHRSPIARPEDAGWRTFIRLDISLKQQDRLGNTLNPDLPAPWGFVPRNLPNDLSGPIQDSSWSGSVKFTSITT